MKKFSSISFFCPAYNDEDNLPEIIREADFLLQKLTDKYEMIIVEDGSPDRTKEVADELTNHYTRLKVIHHKTNQGYGGALKSGFNNARYDHIIYTDGDNQYNVSEFHTLFNLLESKGADVVAGYVSQKAVSLKRKLQSTIYNALIFLLFGIYFKDINCSMKIFKRKVLDKIKINSNSAFIDAEMILKTKKNKFKIVRAEVIHKPRLHGIEGGSKLTVILPTIKEMFKYRLGRLS